MKEKFDSISKSLNTETNIVTSKSDCNISVIKDDTDIVSQTPLPQQDLQKDYEYTRANLYSLIEKGQEALNGIMELASESDSPRAYEVAGQIIKSVGDTTDKLLDLQKKLKEMEENNNKQPTGNVTNNALFVGSTAELSKLLKQGFLNNKE